MKKMRQLMAFSLGLTLVTTSLLTGCGSGAPAASESAEAEVSTVPVSPETLEAPSTLSETEFGEESEASEISSAAEEPAEETAEEAPAAEEGLKDGQVLVDLNFDDGSVGDFFIFNEGGEGEILNKEQALAIHITKTGNLDYSNQAYYDGFAMTEGCKYRLSFDAKSDADCSMQYRIQLNGGDYHAYMDGMAAMTGEMQHFDADFTMEEATDPAPRLAFNMGLQPDMPGDPGEHTVYIDNIRLEVVDCSGAVAAEAEVDLPLLSVNHVGYRPEDAKTVVTDSSLADQSFVVRNDEGETCFEGTFTSLMEDAATGQKICRGDFSELKAEGTYVIAATSDAGELVSQSFVIGESVYEDLTASVFHMLTMQRCGSELTGEVAGEYAHPACHTGEALIYGTKDTKDVSGGWHDAGDYGRYVVPGAQTVADLLYIYEHVDPNPALLEEARYELEWMLKMQDETSGGVYHKVTCANFPGTVMPQDETNQLILAPISDAATGDFAAVMAKASGDYRSTDSAFADTCGLAAVKAWSYLKAKGTLTGFTNPPEIVTGEYPDDQLQDELFWAAVELLDQVEKGNADAGLTDELFAIVKEKIDSGITFGLGWADIGGLAMYDLASFTDPQGDVKSLSELAANRLIAEADSLRTQADQDGYFVSMGTNYYWGSNMGVANNGLLMLMAGDLTKDASWRAYAKRQLDYLLGVNGLDFCYVSGFGEKCLSDPHHRPSQAVGAAVPGMLAGGPNPNLEDPYAQGVLAGKAPALCYVDNQQSFSTNEVAIYWNSPLLALLCGTQQ